MRVRCLLGIHDWRRYGQVAPPPQWSDMPTFALKRCIHCAHSDYDIVWPDGVVPPL